MGERIVFDRDDTLTISYVRGESPRTRVGALDLLDNLKARGHDLIMWTSADRVNVRLHGMEVDGRELYGKFSEVYNINQLPLIPEGFSGEERTRVRRFMEQGVKIPPVVGSRILVDNDIEHMQQVAAEYGFFIVDPRLRTEDKTFDDWVERVSRRIAEITGV